MRKGYTPRRAGARWRAEAPAYILDCFDCGPNVADRYTVFLAFPYSFALDSKGNGLGVGVRGSFANTFIAYLGMSERPSHPQGVSMWGEMRAHEAAAFRYSRKHRRVRWLDIPENVREHVKARAES